MRYWAMTGMPHADVELDKRTFCMASKVIQGEEEEKGDEI
jgi:hypothetical protein